MSAELSAFGLNLKRALKIRGLRQTIAAEKLQISVTYMNQLCKGEKTPSFEMIVKISKLLDIPIDELFGKPTQRDGISRLVFLASRLPDELLDSLCEVAKSLNMTADVRTNKST